MRDRDFQLKRCGVVVPDGRADPRNNLSQTGNHSKKIDVKRNLRRVDVRYSTRLTFLMA